MLKAKGGSINTISTWLIGLAVLAEIINLLSPLPAVSPSYALSFKMTTKPASLPWPPAGQSAIGAQDFGLLAASGAQKPAPIASIAKVITALAVLKQKPLAMGEQGPTLTLTQADVDNYNTALSEDGSVIPVAVGEQITERQALEGMLLPSANNMARSLAEWAFGSLDAYNIYANKMVKSMGMSQTTISDASGFAPTTVSTANDLVNLGLRAMSQPVLAQIVGESSAQVPVAGQVQNINILLGQDGIVGIKTGNTDQAGGCFLFAAKHTVNSQSMTIVGAVMGAPTLYQSMAESRDLVESVDGNFVSVAPVKASRVVGQYKARWGSHIMVVAGRMLPLNVWSGQSVQVSTHLNKLKAGSQAGTSTGTITARSGSRSVSVPAVTGSTLSKPSIWWRLAHP